MEVESGSGRSRVPEASSQENILVNDAVPASSIKTSGCEHFCRMAEVKRGLSSGIRLKWSLQGQDYDLHKVTALSAVITGMDALLLVSAVLCSTI